MEYRIEKDSLGEVKVPAEKLWGAQTERSRQNFKIGGQRMPKEIIEAMILVKKCASKANCFAGKLSKEKMETISNACDELLCDMKDSFPLVVWQTGSGTQSNMNVNEVIANIAKGEKLHPNDDVNMSQSTNDVFPTAIHIATVVAIQNKLIPSIEHMVETAKSLEKENAGLVKVGRTHLQDATPISFSSEISAWRAMLENALEMIKQNIGFVKMLAIGGTAVGTGINAPLDFGKNVVKQLKLDTNIDFCEDENKYHALSSKDALCNMHGVLKTLASNLMKIANDVRWLASGPRAGMGEITIPSNEPGSSIMPGKVNPTQCEALTMVAAEILGNDVTVGIASSNGNFELNVFMPVIGFKMIESINLLADAIESFDSNCFVGIKANTKKMKSYLENSLMVATALSTYIGYDNSAKLVKFAHENELSLKEANEKLKLVDEQKMIEILDKAMTL